MQTKCREVETRKQQPKCWRNPALLPSVVERQNSRQTSNQIETFYINCYWKMSLCSKKFLQFCYSNHHSWRNILHPLCLHRPQWYSLFAIGGAAGFRERHQNSQFTVWTPRAVATDGGMASIKCRTLGSQMEVSSRGIGATRIMVVNSNVIVYSRTSLSINLTISVGDSLKLFVSLISSRKSKQHDHRKLVQYNWSDHIKSYIWRETLQVFLWLLQKCLELWKNFMKEAMTLSMF